MSKYASIERVLDVFPIEGADKIEAIKVLGWVCVSQKGNFKPGDLCVYFTIDSVLPDEPWAEFLGENKRIITRKFKGQISQGLALPVNILPPGYETVYLSPNPEGFDVTEELGVKHYEKEIPLTMQGEIKGSFPSHLCPKTDEVRIQSYPGLLEELAGKSYYSSLKVDGTSATYIWDGEEFWICSRNLAKKKGTDVYSRMAEKYDIEEALKSRTLDGKPVRTAIQCEIIGPGIQKNPLKLEENEIRVFNLYNVDEQKYEGLFAMLAFCELTGLPVVDIIRLQPNFDPSILTIDKLLEDAKGNYEGTTNPREGIVIRPQSETYSPILNGRLSFKVLNNDYLLKNKE
jgi:RNA ligase (TIGR02306 family)